MAILDQMKCTKCSLTLTNLLKHLFFKFYQKIFTITSRSDLIYNLDISRLQTVYICRLELAAKSKINFISIYMYTYVTNGKTELLFLVAGTHKTSTSNNTNNINNKVGKQIYKKCDCLEAVLWSNSGRSTTHSYLSLVSLHQCQSHCNLTTKFEIVCT